MKKVIVCFALLLLFSKFVFDRIDIEFSDIRLNYLYTISLFASLPILLLLSILTQKPKNLWLRIPLTGILALLTFGAIIGIIFSLSDAHDIFVLGKDKSFEKLHEAQIGDYFYTCYRTNGGATTDYGIVIRKESRRFGFIHFRILERLYHAYDAKFYRDKEQWLAEISRTRDEKGVVIKLE